MEERNILLIILDVWDWEIVPIIGEYEAQNLNFDIWVSYIMSFGFSSEEILEVAKNYNISFNPDDYDPDDPEDHYGSLKINTEIIDKIKAVIG